MPGPARSRSVGARNRVFFSSAAIWKCPSTLRRDIFDPETIRAFAEKMGTPERLKMLSLLTYADIKAVNPDALTPWKAENVLQLYIATFNYLNHSVDERLQADQERQSSRANPHFGTDRRQEAQGLSGRAAQAISRRLFRDGRSGARRVGGQAQPGPHSAPVGAGTALVRIDPGHQRPPLPVRHHRGCSRRLGHEHRQGQRIFEPGRQWWSIPFTSPTASALWN